MNQIMSVLMFEVGLLQREDYYVLSFVDWMDQWQNRY